MKISKILKVAAIGTLALTALGAVAAQASQPLMVVRNNMVRVALNGSAASVVVGNPNVADVNVVDSRTIYIIGRGYGQSAVTILDRNGHSIYDSQVVVTAEPQDAVTVFHGNKPQVMLCARVCVADAGSENSSGGGDSNNASAPVIPMISAPSAPAASPLAVTSPAATMAVSQ